MKTQQTGKPILDALLSASESFAHTPAQAHSPLPWQVAEYGIRELKAKYLCIKHGSKTIARIDASGNSLSVTKQDEANAAFIVRACNSKPAADDMADAIEEYLEYASPENYSNVKASIAAWEKAQQ